MVKKLCDFLYIFFDCIYNVNFIIFQDKKIAFFGWKEIMRVYLIFTWGVWQIPAARRARGIPSLFLRLLNVVGIIHHHSAFLAAAGEIGTGQHGTVIAHKLPRAKLGYFTPKNDIGAGQHQKFVILD